MNLHLLHPSRNRTAGTPDFMVAPHRFAAEETIHIKEHGRIKLRPIRTDDEPRMIQFHESLSEESIYLRYFEHISLDTRTLHERLAKVCANTVDSYAIVAECHATSRHPTEILAVGRLTTTETPGVASFATLVGDQVQNTNLPGQLLKRLIAIARAYGFHALSGELLAGDHDTLTICRAFGFTMKLVPQDGIIRVHYPL